MTQVRSSLVQRDSEIMGGTPVFTGTRAPVRALTDYLAAGHNLDEFLDDFPSVDRKQAVAVLELMKDALLSELYANPA